MNLKELLKQQEEKAKAAGVEEQVVQEKVAKYKSMVNEFYQSVLNDWLKELNDDGMLHPEYTDVIINEELTGEYQVKGLTITMAQTKVRFRPIGTFLIGTPGRIDMYVNGNPEPEMFIIAGEKAKSPRIVTQEYVEGEQKPEEPKPIDYGAPVWKYVERTNRMRFVSIDANVFQQIIMEKL